MTASIAVAGLAVAFLITTAVTSLTYERRTFNRSVCESNWLPWTYFGHDSQGEQDYRAGGHRLRVSWPLLDTGHHP